MMYAKILQNLDLSLQKAVNSKSIFDHNSLHVLYSVTQNIITKVALKPYLETLTLLYIPHISTVMNRYRYLETLILLYMPRSTTAVNRYSYSEALTLFHIPHISISRHDSTNKTFFYNACNEENGIYYCYGNIS